MASNVPQSVAAPGAPTIPGPCAVPGAAALLQPGMTISLCKISHQLSSICLKVYLTIYTHADLQLM